MTRVAWTCAAAALLLSLATPARARQGSQPAAPGPSFEDYVRDVRSTDPDTRRRALEALSASGYPDAIAPLAGLLTDPLDAIQLDAIRGILRFYAVDIPPKSRKVGLIVEVRDKAGVAQRVFDAGPFGLIPQRTPPELVTGLTGAMRDDNPRVRSEAAYTTGVVAVPPLDPVAADVLQAALRDPDIGMRVAAARVLGAARVQAAGDVLIAAMNDPEPVVRASAMLALGDIRETRAIQAITEQLNYYEDGPLAEAALDALARIGHPSSLPIFQGYLASRDHVSRRRATEGIARSGDTAAIAALETTLASERQRAVLLARAFALARIGRPSVNELVTGLRAPETEAQAMGYLVELGRFVAPAVAAHLKDPDPAVRARVAMTLGLLGGDEALKGLEAATKDTDLSVARAAERGLARARMLAGRAQP